MAMGSAMTALGTSTTALYDNPANLPFARVYHFEAFAELVPEASRQTYGGAVADSVTNRIAGGLAGAYSMMDPNGIDRRWLDVRLTLAYPLTEWLSVGIAGRYINATQGISHGPFGASLVSDGTPTTAIYSGLTGDAGVTVQPFTGFRIGVVGKNLTVPNNGIVPTTVAGGIGWSNEVFAIEGDGLVDFQTWGTPRPRFGGGAELFLLNHVPLRAGYRADLGQRVQSITFGAGYIDKKLGVEASMRRDVVADHPSTTMMLTLRYFYDSASPADTIGTMQ